MGNEGAVAEPGSDRRPPAARTRRRAYGEPIRSGSLGISTLDEFEGNNHLSVEVAERFLAGVIDRSGDQAPTLDLICQICCDLLPITVASVVLMGDRRRRGNHRGIRRHWQPPSRMRNSLSARARRPTSAGNDVRSWSRTWEMSRATGHNLFRPPGGSASGRSTPFLSGSERLTLASWFSAAPRRSPGRTSGSPTRSLLEIGQSAGPRSPGGGHLGVFGLGPRRHRLPGGRASSHGDDRGPAQRRGGRSACTAPSERLCNRSPDRSGGHRGRGWSAALRGAVIRPVGP